MQKWGKLPLVKMWCLKMGVGCLVTVVGWNFQNCLFAQRELTCLLTFFLKHQYQSEGTVLHNFCGVNIWEFYQWLLCKQEHIWNLVEQEATKWREIFLTDSEMDFSSCPIKKMINQCKVKDSLSAACFRSKMWKLLMIIYTTFISACMYKKCFKKSIGNSQITLTLGVNWSMAS